jgi:hypothetical protein
MKHDGRRSRKRKIGYSQGEGKYSALVAWLSTCTRSLAPMSVVGLRTCDGIYGVQRREGVTSERGSAAKVVAL